MKVYSEKKVKYGTILRKINGDLKSSRNTPYPENLMWP